MGILDLSGITYATDSSISTKGMGAGFRRHDIKGEGCSKVGAGQAVASWLGRKLPPPAWRWRILRHTTPIAVLTDSKGLMTVSSNWVGGWKDPLRPPTLS